jgi:hypothetical protein
MAGRTIGIYPQTRYHFRSNASYRGPWDFLPNERAKVIAEQLTYLEFHEWLMNNLRHAREHEPRNGEWLPLGLTVAEGFYKTDLRLRRPARQSSSLPKHTFHMIFRSALMANLHIISALTRRSGEFSFQALKTIAFPLSTGTAFSPFCW